MKTKNTVLPKRAQNWSVDYTVSIVLFAIVIYFVFTLTSNFFSEQEFELVLSDAHRLANALVSDGYPKYWDETDVARAGLLADGRLSYRKLAILSAMTPAELYAALPSSFPYAITIENTDGEIMGIGENCSIGEQLPQITTPLITTGRAAYYYRTDSENEFFTWASTNDADIYTDNNLSALFTNASAYDLIIFEDPQFNRLLNSTYGEPLLREDFSHVASYGPVIVLTGRLGVPVLGANTTDNATNGSVVTHNESFFFLNTSAELNYSKNYAITFLSTDNTLLGNIGGATHIRTMATGENTIAARWQYKDALVYYFSASTGTHSGDPLKPILLEGLSRAAELSTVNCTVAPEDIATTDLIKLERFIAGEGEVLSLKLYVWREP